MTVLDFLIAAAVAVWFGAVVLHAVRRRRKGCGGCACGCSGVIGGADTISFVACWT